ncbi:MAG TPA: type II toxin-antitoxin system VapB family antitoxin, partial [Candidatus Acidoferrales bacterium]|nr:type II toxin-antitoxin system VapB family antitoxin [Candidatus Acidoferrales bacterium]
GHKDSPVLLVFSSPLKSTSGMLMNFVVDDDHLMRLIEKAQKLGQHRTQDEAVETALKEYVHERQEQRNT